MSMTLAPGTTLDRSPDERVGWKDLTALTAARASTRMAQTLEGIEELSQKRWNGPAPVVVIVIGVAIVAAAGGLVAFLTTWCVAQGYAGFGGVLNVQEIDGGTQYSVSFQCIPWPWDA